MGAKYPRENYFSESRKHFDKLHRDFEKLQMSPHMHVESKKEFYGKSISEMIYKAGYSKTCGEVLMEQERQQRAREAQQNMAVTDFGGSGTGDCIGRPGDWTKVNTVATVSRVEVERMRSPFWEQEFDAERGEKVWRLNTRMVADELKRLPKPVWNKIRNDQRAFDQHFGPGAYTRSYGAIKPEPRYTPEEEAMGYNRKSNFPKVAKDAAHVTQLIRPKFEPTKMMTPFEVGDPKRSVARQLEIDHKAHMADGGSKGKMFHVEHDESLLDALQRQFDAWVGIQPAKKKRKGTHTKGWTKNMFTSTSGTYTGMDLAGPHS